MALSTDAIKTKALELGFDLCGIASADAFPELSFLSEWLERGYAGEMSWMTRTRDRRADVRHVVPGARSVIVTATLYNTDRPYSDELPPDVARVSRYAWGDDYHDVIKSRLEALLAWMRRIQQTPPSMRALTSIPDRCRNVYTRNTPVWDGSARTRA